MLQNHTSDHLLGKSEREILHISTSSAYNPWSVVHTCVLASASTDAMPCFPVPVGAHPSAPRWMPLITALSQTYEAILSKATPNPVKNYSALALSKAINKWKPNTSRSEQ